MSVKTLIRLVVALAILTGLAYWLNRPAGKITVEGVASGDALLPALDVNAITRMEVSSGAATSVLVRTDRGWVSETWYGYRAKFDQIADALRTLSDMKVGQVMRDGKKDLAELGLDPGVSAPDYQRITLVDASNTATVIHLGALKQQREASGMGMGMPTGRYIRNGEGPVVLVAEMLTSIVSSPGEWVDRELLKLAADDIATVSIVGTNDEFTIRRNDENQFDIGRIEEGATVDQSAVLRVLQAFQSLNFASLADPSLTEEQAGLTAHELVTVRTRDQHEYQLKIGPLAEGSNVRPVRIGVSWKPEGEPGDDQAAKTEEAKKLNDRFAGWTYQLPAGVVNQLLASRAGLVTKPAPAAAE